MFKMLAINSSYVRKNFSEVFDDIVRYNPVFIKKHRQYIVGMNLETLKELLSDVTIIYTEYSENDESITLSLEHFDSVVNAPTKTEAMKLLISDLREYVLEYYKNTSYWSSDHNRKKQIKAIMKVLLTEDNAELEGVFKCIDGKN